MKVKTLVLAALGFLGVLLAPALASAACIPNGAWVNGIFYDGAKLCAADLNANNNFLIDQGGGTGSVNTGTANDLGYYAATGKVISPIAAVPSALLSTNSSGAPSESTTLPTGIDLSTGAVTATGATTANSLASRFARTISVLDEGATCTGSGHDDTAAFAAAFTLAGAGGTVTAPSSRCYAATGVVIPAEESLVGTTFSPGNPNAGTVIECPASLNAACLTVGASGVNEASSVSNLTVEYTGSVTSGDTADQAILIQGFNSAAHNVMALNAYDGFTWANGIASHSDHLYTGQILNDHFVDNGFPELYVVNFRMGINGSGDVSSNAFVSITGSNPNTIQLDDGQYNLGSLSPKYWLDFHDITSQTDGIYSFTNSTLDMSIGAGGFNLGLIHSDSSANLFRFLINNVSFNAPGTPFFTLNTATRLFDFDLSHSKIYASTLTMPASIPYDVHFDHNLINLNGGLTTITTSGSTTGEAELTGNTVQGPITFSGSWGLLSVSNTNIFNSGPTITATGTISGLGFTSGDALVANGVNGIGDVSTTGVMTIPAPSGRNAVLNLISPNSSQSSGVNFYSGATEESGVGYNEFTNGYIFQIDDYINSTQALSVSSSGLLKLGEPSVASDMLGPLNLFGIVSQCLQANSSGQIIGSGSLCGSGSGTPGGSNTDVQYNNSSAFGGNGGFVYDGTSKITLGVAGTSVGGVALQNATSGSITLNPPTGALGTVTATVPAHTGTISETNLAETLTAAKTFTNSDLLLLGSSTGATTFTSANAGASNFTLTFPAVTDTVAAIAATQSLTNKSIAGSEINSSLVGNTYGGTGANLSATGGTNQVVQQATSGGALTVGQLAASNLSNGTTGTGSVVLANQPTFVTAANVSASSGLNAFFDVIAPNSSQSATVNFYNAATAESGIGYNNFVNGYTFEISDYVNSAQALTITSGGVLGLGESGKTIVLNNAVATIGTTQNAMCITSGGVIQQQATSCVVSARRFKTDIQPLAHGLDWISRLTPSTYVERQSGAPRVGLIADDAGAVDKRLAAYNPDGSVQTIQPEAIIAVLTKAVQQEEAEIKSLQIKVSALRGANDNESHHRLRRAR